MTIVMTYATIDSIKIHAKPGGCKVVMTRADWVCVMDCICEALEANAPEFSRLDAATGDGDHGVTMERMAAAIRAVCEEDDVGGSSGELLTSLGDAAMGLNGGSSALLWGCVFKGLGRGLGEEASADELKAAFLNAREALEEVSGARVGDKTLMDAFIPAVEAMEGDSIPDMMRAAAKAAKAGADATRSMIAKVGRARNLRERSVGALDPGAVSMAVFFESFSHWLDANRLI